MTRSLLLVLGVLLATPYLSHALSCFCGSQPCETPTCCDSGSFSGDVCACCTVCAKKEGDNCGGPWGISGTCAENLSCFKSCGCETVNRKKCVFPFRYMGKVYEGCTNENSENGQPWCATAVDKVTGDVISGFWEDCAGGCPGSDYPCDLFNVDGVCVNETFKATVEAERDTRIDPVSNEPNYEFHEGVKDYKGDRSIEAPVCSSLSTTIEGNTPIKVTEGEVGECKCTTEKNSKGEGPCRIPQEWERHNTGWCFLEAIADPQEPTKNCFKDVAWSPTAGRFWSGMACKNEEPTGPTPPEPTFNVEDYDGDEVSVVDLDGVSVESGNEEE